MRAGKPVHEGPKPDALHEPTNIDGIASDDDSPGLDAF